MEKILEQKIEQLKSRLGKFKTVAVAFSGGVDSTLLLAIAASVKLSRLIAVTAASPFMPEKELRSAERIAADLNVEHLVLKVDILKDDQVISNPFDRCFHCKNAIFSKIFDAIRNKQIAVLVHGVNVDDLGDYRPGLKAAQMMGVKSPLLDAGFSKSDIRQASKVMKLPTWNQPSQSCLAARIPYHSKITKELLVMIESAETFLHDQGFEQVRVRVHGNLARIEVEPEFLKKIMKKEAREKITRELKRLGFQYISVDMLGYKTGKMNCEVH